MASLSRDEQNALTEWIEHNLNGCENEQNLRVLASYIRTLVVRQASRQSMVALLHDFMGPSSEKFVDSLQDHVNRRDFARGDGWGSSSIPAVVAQAPDKKHVGMYEDVFKERAHTGGKRKTQDDEYEDRRAKHRHRKRVRSKKRRGSGSDSYSDSDDSKLKRKEKNRRADLAYDLDESSRRATVSGNVKKSDSRSDEVTRHKSEGERRVNAPPESEKEGKRASQSRPVVKQDRRSGGSDMEEDTRRIRRSRRGSSSSSSDSEDGSWGKRGRKQNERVTEHTERHERVKRSRRLPAGSDDDIRKGNRCRESCNEWNSHSERRPNERKRERVSKSDLDADVPPKNHYIVCVPGLMEHMNSIGALWKEFGTFGDIVVIQENREKGYALIEFAALYSAFKVVNSKRRFFENEFIRPFFAVKIDEEQLNAVRDDHQRRKTHRDEVNRMLQEQKDKKERERAAQEAPASGENDLLDDMIRMLQERMRAYEVATTQERREKLQSEIEELSVLLDTMAQKTLS